jgi:DNA end-binding protein Ku
MNIEELEGLDDVEISDKELKMAEQLVASLAGPFELERYPDSYRLQVLDLLEKRAAGEEIEVPERPATAPQVVDLMAALEASVKAAKEARGRHPTAKADADDDGAVAEVTDVAKRPARKAAAAKTTAKAAKAPAARKRKSA